jgi:hypothetical protein
LSQKATRSFEEFVSALVTHFNKEKIIYAITGAVAASYYGVPRTTVDVDFVIKVSPRQRGRFFKSLETIDVKADLKRIRRQLESGYTVITVDDKLAPRQADLILSEAPLERRRGTIMGVKAYFESPQSLILAKLRMILRMIRATTPHERSIKDREDIRHILSNTRVSKRRLQKLAKEQRTDSILTELFES